MMETTIVERTTRPTGTPPRCRQCGAVCHLAQRTHTGGAFDRVCTDCNRVLAGGFRDDETIDADHRRRPLGIAAWAAGEPFDIPALRERTRA